MHLVVAVWAVGLARRCGSAAVLLLTSPRSFGQALALEQVVWAETSAREARRAGSKLTGLRSVSPELDREEIA